MDYNLTMLTTITELPEYIRRANSLLGESERRSYLGLLLTNGTSAEPGGNAKNGKMLLITSPDIRKREI